MCTVTYLPKKKGFILTTNRDEDKSRAAKVIFPNSFEFDEEVIVFPKDPQGGGTWIASDNKGKVVCLLNGGKEKHKRKSSYKKSRGLVVLDAFGYPSAKEFINHYDFSGVEPFTLVLVDHQKGVTVLSEIIWDGEKAKISNLDNSTPRIWSSSTLYEPSVKKAREDWFSKFLKKGDFSVFGIRKFHRFAGDGDIKNKLKMERDNHLGTVSITSVEFDEQGGEFTYEDLIKEKTIREFL